MTSCKEVEQKNKVKRTVFDVRIEIEEEDRDKIVERLRDKTLFNFETELATIIEKG